MKLSFKKKPADLSRSTSTCSSSSSVASSYSRNTTTTVLAVECVGETSNTNEWSNSSGGGGGTSSSPLQTGDIVEEIRIGELSLRSPFKNGRSGVQKILGSSYQKNQTSILLRFRPAGRNEVRELQAWIVPSSHASSRGKKEYVLRVTGDPLNDIRFFDCTESECLELQASRTTKIQQTLNTTRVQDGYETYPWESKMQEEGLQQGSSSSNFLSILIFPKVSSDDNSSSKAPRYSTVEDTLARANAWLLASQSSGIPIICTNVQTESLLTKISGDKATPSVSTISDLPNIANVSLYGLEDYHGVDIGIVRAVRLWYSPIGGEYKLTMDINEDDTKLGFVISRTEEGFIYISSVLEGDENVPASRSGLSKLFRQAEKASKLLVVSRINKQKILPWLVSQQGKIRCFDTVSLSQNLSLHRHAKAAMILHLFMWDDHYDSTTTSLQLQPSSTKHLAQMFSNIPSQARANHYHHHHHHAVSISSLAPLEPVENDDDDDDDGQLRLPSRDSAALAPDHNGTSTQQRLSDYEDDSTVVLGLDDKDAAELDQAQREMMLNDIQAQRRKLDEMLDHYLKAKSSSHHSS